MHVIISAKYDSLYSEHQIQNPLTSSCNNYSMFVTLRDPLIIICFSHNAGVFTFALPFRLFPQDPRLHELILPCEALRGWAGCKICQWDIVLILHYQLRLYPDGNDSYTRSTREGGDIRNIA